MKSENIIDTKYVWNINVYGALMNGNISRVEFDEEREQKAKEAILEMISNEDSIIKSLLEIENWRAKTIVGCLIGFKNKKEYLPLIGELFLNGCGGITGYCYAFAKFADEESVNYLKYLDKYLKIDMYPQEKFQNLVLSSLRWIDKIKKTDIANHYLQEDGLWTKFVNYREGGRKSLSELGLQWRDIKVTDESFERMMRYYQINFERI